MFEIVSKFKPSGDQPQAIEKLVKGIESGVKEQVLLGATGTGKTFTMANVIQRTNKQTLILAHNKTLAGQLYAEMMSCFLIIMFVILFLITIIINQKPMYLVLILI